MTTNKEIKSNNDDLAEFPLHYTIIFIAMIISFIYVIKQLSKLNLNVIACNSSDIICRFSYYDFLLIPTFISSGIITFLLMKFYSKINFMRIISAYMGLVLLLSFTLSFIFITLAFGGYGNLSIYHYFPINIFLKLLLSITSKYMFFNIASYCFWALTFLFFKHDKFATFKNILPEKKQLYILIFFILILLIVLFSSIEYYSILAFFITFFIILPFAFNYNKQEISIKINRIFILLFLLNTFWPTIYNLLNKSDLLTTFAFK